MTGARIHKRQFLVFLLPALFITCLTLTTPAAAQSPQPSAEQMRMINQLPPAQRQQAMEALRQYQSQQQGSSWQGTDTSRLAEELSEGGRDDDERRAAELELETAEPSAQAGTALIITMTPRINLSANELRELEDDRALSELQGSNFYELDDNGVLELPGLRDIPLRGLTADAIMARLGAERALEPFDITVSILQTEVSGAAALEPFGYDIFEATDADFDPALSGPVPADFVLGTGDIVRVQLYGNVNNSYELEVTRDGTLNLPELGPMTVSGLRFSEFRNDIEQRVQQMLIGTQVSVTMGALRTIRVFVLGDVNRPGSYVVSSLATISSALYRSGGISDVGTLRDIQLKRQGSLVTRFDLYDLLLEGDTSDDVQLRQGDVIFVPPIGTTIGVGGEVRRPAIYETRRDLTLGAAIRLAGGLSAEAYPEGSTLERIGDNRKRRVLSVNLGSDAGRAMPVQSGDTLMIPRVLPELTDTVELKGHVYRAGPYQWRPGMRLSDLLESLQALRPGADPNYVLIRRESANDLQVTTLAADLALALAEPASDNNVRLEPRDEVHVFNLAFGRQRVIEPILQELKQQATYDAAYEEVRIAGQVRAPGSYPLQAGMRVSDLLRAGGNLDEAAFTEEAELTRFTVIDGEYREKEVIPVNLSAVLRGDTSADLMLSPYDHLRISPVPDWNSDWSITLDGEVRFPGEYQILRGETLRDVIARAGGLTDRAFPEGAVFLREDLREREREQIERLIRRMESDLASLSLQTAETTGAETLDLGQSLLEQLRTTEPTGRLVIDVEQMLSRNTVSRQAYDLELKDGDRLLIPGRSQSVTVLGEAQYPASHLYSPGLDRDEYIAKSGGLTRQADNKLIYVVRASGEVESGNRSRWFSRGSDAEIRPGDTIVVPLATDRIRPLTFWGNVTQILYQGAIAVAAVRTFNN